VERLRDCTPTSGLFTDAADEIERLRRVYLAAVEFRWCFYHRPVNEEFAARDALLNAVTAALEVERRG
jgi:hypothetical protein